jgi:hypothetical protein
MINPFYTDKSVSIHLSFQAVNTEYSLTAQQIHLLTDVFEWKIKNFTQEQLLFLKACLNLQRNLEGKSTDSLLYKLFLIEQHLEKFSK